MPSGERRSSHCSISFVWRMISIRFVRFNTASAARRVGESPSDRSVGSARFGLLRPGMTKFFSAKNRVLMM